MKKTKFDEFLEENNKDTNEPNMDDTEFDVSALDEEDDYFEPDAFSDFDVLDEFNEFDDEEDENLITKNEVAAFLKNFDYMQFENFITNKVVGQDCLPDIIFNIYTFIQSINIGKIVKNNMIICGPSGSGKTHLYRTLEEALAYFDLSHLPVMHIDAGQLTQEGFKGTNVSNILKNIAAIKNGNPENYCIVFLDEFDKKLLPSYDSHGTNINALVQFDLLTMLEGVEKEGADTRNVLFIAEGAFQGVRDKKKEQRPKNFGFGEKESKEETISDEITFDDLVKEGTSFELLGRFTGGMYNFKKISGRKFNNMIKSIARELVPCGSVEIKISSKAFKEFSELAESEYGCRMIKRQLVATLNPVLRKMTISGALTNSKWCIHIAGIGKAKYKMMSAINLEEDVV